MAGGLELLLNCDFALAAESARIGDGHLNFGQMGGGGVLTLLHRVVGRAKAVELMLTGRLLPADEACAWGLVSRVVPDDELLDAGLGLVAEIARQEPAGRRQRQAGHAPDLGRQRLGRRRPRSSSSTADAYYCLTSHDAPEGLAAFAETRPPRFEGR